MQENVLEGCLRPLAYVALGFPATLGVCSWAGLPAMDAAANQDAPLRHLLLVLLTLTLGFTPFLVLGRRPKDCDRLLMGSVGLFVLVRNFNLLGDLLQLAYFLGGLALIAPLPAEVTLMLPFLLMRAAASTKRLVDKGRAAMEEASSASAGAASATKAGASKKEEVTCDT
jgi:hypothetical protein